MKCQPKIESLDSYGGDVILRINDCNIVILLTSPLEKTFSMGMSCMLSGVWLEAERKCYATVVDLLLFKNATVFIKSVFYFVISHARNRVVRESAAHASIQLCGPCVKK